VLYPSFGGTGRQRRNSDQKEKRDGGGAGWRRERGEDGCANSERLGGEMTTSLQGPEAEFRGKAGKEESWGEARLKTAR